MKKNSKKLIIFCFILIIFLGIVTRLKKSMLIHEYTNKIQIGNYINLNNESKYCVFNIKKFNELNDFDMYFQSCEKKSILLEDVFKIENYILTINDNVYIIININNENCLSQIKKSNISSINFLNEICSRKYCTVYPYASNQEFIIDRYMYISNRGIVNNIFQERNSVKGIIYNNFYDVYVIYDVNFNSKVIDSKGKILLEYSYFDSKIYDRFKQFLPFLFK